MNIVRSRNGDMVAEISDEAFFKFTKQQAGKIVIKKFPNETRAVYEITRDFKYGKEDLKLSLFAGYYID